MRVSDPTAVDRRGSRRQRASRPWYVIRPRSVRAALPWLALLGAIFVVAAMLAMSASDGWGFDFEAYYLASLRLARGDEIYLSWTLAGPFRPGPYSLYLYAPPLAVALLPLTALSLSSATVLWVAIRIVLLASACWLMPVRREVRFATFAVAAFSSTILIDLHLGNVSVIVAFLSVVTWRWLDRAPGAVALALAMSIRPTMGLVLIWALVRRQWRFVAITVTAGLALIATTLPFVAQPGGEAFIGQRAYEQFLAVLRNVSDVTGVANNLDLGSTALRFGLGPIAATIALFVGYAIGIGAMIVGLRHGRELGYVVTLGATLLLAPLLWDHYLASLIVPAAFLAQRRRWWGMLLPLATWLPDPLIPLVVVASTVLPLVVAAGEHRREAPPTESRSDDAGQPAFPSTTAENAPAVST